MGKFDDAYRETCFNVWLSADCPDGLRRIQEVLPLTAEGEKPSLEVVRMWLNQDWKFRADYINSRAQEVADEDLIQRKAEMLKQQAERGRKLQLMGIEYLESEGGGFDSSSSAVSAIINGAKLERESMGIGDLIERMSRMSDTELKSEIVKRLTDLQEEKENTVDAEVGDAVSDEQIPTDKSD